MAIIVSPARRCLSDFANRCFPFGDDTVARNVLKNFKGNQKNIKVHSLLFYGKPFPHFLLYLFLNLFVSYIPDSFSSMSRLEKCLMFNSIKKSTEGLYL